MKFSKVLLPAIISLFTVMGLLTVDTAPATAQPALEQIGITTGVVNNNVRSNLGSMDSRAGLRVSLYTDVRLTRSIFTTAEFGYVQRGYHEDMEFVQPDGSEQEYRTDLVTGRASTGHLLLGLSANFERKLLGQTWTSGRAHAWSGLLHGKTHRSRATFLTGSWNPSCWTFWMTPRLESRLLPACATWPLARQACAWSCATITT